MHSEGLDRTITKFIELYGDRAGEMGEEVHGGLAWIGDAKFILLTSRDGEIQNASSWRRISRLVSLAQHLRRPVLLWDLPLQVLATGLHGDSLVINEAIQDSRLKLLKMRSPVISVFEKRFPVLLESELAMVDGAVIVSDAPDSCVSTHEHLPHITTVNERQHDLSSEILALLDTASKICVEDLERRRIDQVRMIAMQSD